MRAVVVGGSSGGTSPQPGETAALESQVGAISVVLDLALVVILVRMIWRPGV